MLNSWLQLHKWQLVVCTVFSQGWYRGVC